MTPRDAAEIKITVLDTGSVQIKSAQLYPKKYRSGLMRKWDMIRDKRWIEVPIYTFLIQHSQYGNFLVDSGDSWKSSLPGHSTWWHPITNSQVKSRIAPREEIDLRLKQIGVDIDSLKMLILTHMHADHCGGLHHFPHTPILVDQEQFKASKGFKGKFNGYLPQHIPLWFQPNFIKYKDGAIGPFTKFMSLTPDDSIIILPTPGHVQGHISVLIKESKRQYLITGDAAYIQDSIHSCNADGVTMDPELQVKTLNKIKALCSSSPTIVLCSHDWQTKKRLEEEQYFSDLDPAVSQISL